MSEDRPTLDTVAKAAGVSRMTVSNAYNRPDQLSEKTRAHVLAVAEHLGYPGPDPAGRSLRRGRADSVGVLLSEDLSAAFSDPGLVAFLEGIADELSTARQAMLLIPAEVDVDGALVRDAIVDAFITCSVDEAHPSLAAVLSRRLPVVAAGIPRLEGVPGVGIDNTRGGTIVGEHLLGLGHRRFGVVMRSAGRSDASPRTAPRVGLRQRYEGFSRAVEEAGLPASAISVVEVPDSTIAAGRAAVEQLLVLPPRRRPTAVFAVTDALALGVLDAAHAVGLRVPRDLSVVGFDDIAEAARSRPALTTVSQALREQGAQSAILALRQVEGHRVRSVRIDAELVVRDSTGPAA
jgi:DNA-binding LacI/PurR family transcriptional regulator